MKKYFASAIIVSGLFYIFAAGSQAFQSETEQETDSLALDRARHVQAVKEAIKGKENLPADSVFENIRILKGVPAGRIPGIMDIGFSKSLGVSCGHCHDTNKWSSEEKLTKQIARDMFEFSARVRNDLNGIESLKSRAPVVINCTTCHRGATKPALNLN